MPVGTQLESLLGQSYREKALQSTGSLPKWLQWQDWSRQKAESWSPIQDSHVEGMGLSTWVVLFFFPLLIN